MLLRIKDIFISFVEFLPLNLLACRTQPSAFRPLLSHLCRSAAPSSAPTRSLLIRRVLTKTVSWQFAHNGNRLVAWGGSESDLHVLDTGILRWETPSISGEPPVQRTGHNIVPLDREKFMVFGGRKIELDEDGACPSLASFFLDLVNSDTSFFQTSRTLKPQPSNPLIANTNFSLVNHARRPASQIPR
jgi:hypothetical protein